MYNLICLGSFLIVLILSYFLEKFNKTDLILRIFSFLIFFHKLSYYIKRNIEGNFFVPVEISQITYILMYIILAFKINYLYGVGAFYGILAGIGYFTFYIFLGFTVAKSFTLYDILTGCFSHGYLFLTGIHLFKKYQFDNTDKLKIWVTIFAMLSWALVFYDIQMRGITFIYYIIKPKFLYIFESMSLNVILIMLYYALLVTAFYFIVRLFIKLNNKLKTENYQTTKITNAVKNQNNM